MTTKMSLTESLLHFRDNLESICIQKVENLLKRQYQENNGQSLANELAMDIMRAAKEKEKVLLKGHMGYQYICNAFLFEKKSAELLFFTRCLWDEKWDDIITVQRTSNDLYCFIYLYCINMETHISLSDKDPLVKLTKLINQ